MAGLHFKSLLLGSLVAVSQAYPHGFTPTVDPSGQVVEVQEPPSNEGVQPGAVGADGAPSVAASGNPWAANSASYVASSAVSTPASSVIPIPAGVPSSSSSVIPIPAAVSSGSSSSPAVHLSSSSSTSTSEGSTSSPTYVPTNNNNGGSSSLPSSSNSYWISDIKRQGTVAFGDSSDFKVFRNVKDYGAKGDGSTDDTAAINSAITDGSRCGKGCDSSTVTPAIIYFPPGTYAVSAPIVQLYYTQFIGDALDLPTLKATAGFKGMAVIDSDPYNDDGSNWYTNQNNFFRQVRNFVIDLTEMPASSGAGIHWQVAQATSLQNIVFNMAQGGTDNKQQGVFMDNGSGGWMTDLVFNGGNQGMFLGNQQFTTRNLTFNGCNTAIFMNWNWAWTFKSVSINNCKLGVDMATGSESASGNAINQTVGSILFLDSKFTNTPIGFNTSFSTSANTPTSGGTLVLDNVDFTGSTTAVQDYTGTSVLAGGSVVKSWAQGKTYTGSKGASARDTLSPVTKPTALLDGNNVFERSKPQYENVPSSSFVSIKSKGAKGDGTTDDTKAIQAAMDGLESDEILYFDHGAYIVTDTIQVPSKIKITGEIWPLILASGSNFQDQSSLKPVFQVGQEGSTELGAVEMSDLIFGVAGPAPGAVLMQWNLNGDQGANGLWDVHFRVGGYAGSQLQSDTCSKDPTTDNSTPNSKCIGAGLLFHATSTASLYFENNWFWVADHELDLSDHNQIDIYNGRGVLLESQGAVWMYGTSAEHSVLYNYQLNGAKNVYMALIQTETPYFQSNPVATTPFKIAGSDPTFANCGGDKSCEKAWGLRVVDSSDSLIYGAGLYSFYDNYDQTCLATGSCQANILSVEGETSNFHVFGLSTKASVNMVTSSVGMSNGANEPYSSLSLVKDADNRSNFCATIAFWTAG